MSNYTNKGEHILACESFAWVPFISEHNENRLAKDADIEKRMNNTCWQIAKYKRLTTRIYEARKEYMLTNKKDFYVENTSKYIDNRKYDIAEKNKEIMNDLLHKIKMDIYNNYSDIISVINNNDFDSDDILKLDKPITRQKYVHVSILEQIESAKIKESNKRNHKFIQKFIKNYVKLILVKILADYNINVANGLLKHGLMFQLDNISFDIKNINWDKEHLKYKKLNRDMRIIKVCDNFYNGYLKYANVHFDTFKTLFQAQIGYNSSTQYQSRCINSIKFRGCFNSEAKANMFVEKLCKNNEKIFDIYILKVGVWYPFHINDKEVERQKTTSKEYNRLLNAKLDNIDNAEQIKGDLEKEEFEHRLEDNIDTSKYEIVEKVIKKEPTELDDEKIEYEIDGNEIVNDENTDDDVVHDEDNIHMSQQEQDRINDILNKLI